MVYNNLYNLNFHNCKLSINLLLNPYKGCNLQLLRRIILQINFVQNGHKTMLKLKSVKMILFCTSFKSGDKRFPMTRRNSMQILQRTQEFLHYITFLYPSLFSAETGNPNQGRTDSVVENQGKNIQF